MPHYKVKAGKHIGWDHKDPILDAAGKPIPGKFNKRSYEAGDVFESHSSTVANDKNKFELVSTGSPVSRPIGSPAGRRHPAAAGTPAGGLHAHEPEGAGGVRRGERDRAEGREDEGRHHPGHPRQQVIRRGRNGHTSPHHLRPGDRHTGDQLRQVPRRDHALVGRVHSPSLVAHRQGDSLRLKEGVANHGWDGRVGRRDNGARMSAHYYTQMDPLYKSRTTAGGSGSFAAQDYKACAVDLDVSGCLNSILLRKRAGVQWLGKTTQEALTWDERNDVSSAPSP